MSTGIQLPELQGFAGCRPNCNSDILFRRFTFLVSEPTSQSTNVFRIAGHLAWLHEQFFKSSPILTESENIPRWYAHPSSPFQCNFSCWFELNLEHCRPKLSGDLGNMYFSSEKATQPLHICSAEDRLSRWQRFVCHQGPMQFHWEHLAPFGEQPLLLQQHLRKVVACCFYLGLGWSWPLLCCLKACSCCHTFEPANEKTRSRCL